eukprot:2993988-Lingulodinium_polyedra.AAC.1
MELTNERGARQRTRDTMQEKLDEQSAVIEQLQFATPAPSLSGGAGNGTGHAAASRGPAVVF